MSNDRYQSRVSTHADGCWSWGQGHYECAVREIKALQAEVERLKAENEALQAEVDALRQALAAMVSWFPSADTYRRLGFDPSAPMEALKEAKAVLFKEVRR